MTRTVYIVSFIFVFLFFSMPAESEPLRADAVVERRSVFAGEPFVLQIQVSGSENPEKPNLSTITEFTIQYRGGQQNSSSSISIVNGRITKNVKRGYFFSYQLTPKRTGRLTIPSILIQADGKTAQTQPVIITVKKPAETDDFKLRLHLSKQHCYVGEPVILTFTWYLGKDVRSFKFDLPLLANDSFYFADPKVDTSSSRQYYRIPLGDDQVIGEKGRGRFQGQEYATISFKKVLIPKEPGNVEIKPATVVCEALSGYRRERNSFGNDFFSDFFNDDFFGRNRRGVYQNVVVPSNSLTLRVSDVPLEGRPDNFAGHVGEYRISASATPTQISVGDPITLTVNMSGPDYLEYVTLPQLNTQKSLIQNFKIPAERALGEISDNAKLFTQTIRALRPDVKEIPSIELPYFDTRSGTYQVARSEPIPITVKTARIVTALDAEGISSSVSEKSKVETWTQGIAHNYEDMDALENQRFGPLSWLKSSVFLCLLGIPPVVYVMLLSGVVIVRRRQADPLAYQAKKAYSRLTNSLKKAKQTKSSDTSNEIILDSLRNYLGDKLRIPGRSITFGDIRGILHERGIDRETLDSLKKLFEQCEAGRYAGTSDLSDTASLLKQSISLAKRLEKRLT